MITKDILNKSVTGDVKPVEVTFFYKAVLSVVAFIMVLLPLIYLGIVAIAAYGVYFFAHDPLNFLTARDSFLWSLVFYLTPIVVNALIVVFMVKPFFVRLNKQSFGIEIKREDEPVLFDLIDLVCEKVNAQRPKRVLINNEVNAAAKFADGVPSFIRGDLELVIGMPLVSTMKVSELGGILAHEFGHFSQGAGMRVSFIVRTISSWFFRVVFDRDKWDDKLRDWSMGGHFASMLIFALSRLGIWVSRLILHGLMIIGNFFSSVMLRQMEFDADRYEIRFAGTNNFVGTTKRLQLVNWGMATIHQNIFENFSNKKLNNSIPVYLNTKIKNADKKLFFEIEKNINESKTGFFDTHPSDKARIDSALKENAVGIFELNASARDLFKNFEKASTDVTIHFYKSLLQNDFNEKFLVDVDDFMEGDIALEQNNKALVEFFFQTVTAYFPINFKNSLDGNLEEYSINHILEIKDYLNEKQESIHRLIETEYGLLDKFVNLEGAQAIVRNGGKIQAKAFGLKKGKLTYLNEQLDQLKEEEQEIYKAYKPHREKIARLAQILAFLLKDEEILPRFEELVECEIKFAEFYQRYRNILSLYQQFLIFRLNEVDLGGKKTLVDGLAQIKENLKKELRSAHEYFSDIKNPFDKTSTLADFLFPDGVQNMMGDLVVGIFQSFDQLYHLSYGRIVGEIGVIAMEKINEK